MTTVNRIRVTLVDHIRGTKTQVEVPDNVPMKRLVPALVGRLGLPTDQNGQPVSYRLDSLQPDGQTAERIQEDQTLADANIQSGGMLALFPEVTAGGRTINPLVRRKRLGVDWERLQALHNKNGLVRIEQVLGDPPDQYLICFTCRGIKAIDAMEAPIYHDYHMVALRMPSTYPAEQPLIEWLTPIFHPNIQENGQAVCIGVWLPGMTLDELIWMLGEMIQYKNYASYNPLNLKASLWAMRHRDLFPVDKRLLAESQNVSSAQHDLVDVVLL